MKWCGNCMMWTQSCGKTSSVTISKELPSEQSDVLSHVDCWLSLQEIRIWWLYAIKWSLWYSQMCSKPSWTRYTKLQATIPSEVVMPGVMPESNQTDNNLLSTQPEPLSTDAEPFGSTMESVWANLENTTFFSPKWWHQVAASTMSDGSASKNDTIATDNPFEVLQNSSKTRWIPSQEKKLSLSRHAIEVSKTQQAFGCSHRS